MGLIIGLALLARAALPAAAYLATGDTRIFRAPDTGSYIACAESLLRSGSFSRDGAPEIVRTPGYPALLMAGVASGHVAAVTITLQIALGGATVWLVCRMALAVSGRGRAAALAGALCAIEPLSVLYCGIILGETLFAAAIALFLYLFILFLDRGRTRFLVASAASLAAAAYVRPLACGIAPVMAVFLAAAWKKGAEGLGKALAFLCICVAITGAWQVRNFIEAGYRGFSGIGAQALYYYHAAAVDAAVRGEPYYEVQRRMGYRDAGGVSSDPRRLELMSARGRAVIRAHPLTFAKIYLAGVARAALDPGAVDYLKFFGRYREGSGLLGRAVDRGAASAAAALAREMPSLLWSGALLGAALLFYLACAFAAFLPGAARRVPRAAVAVTALCIMLLSGGPNALGRFRQPVMPLVCVLAGCGLARLKRVRRLAESSRLAAHLPILRTEAE